MKTNEYMEQTEQYVLHTYNRFPLVIDHGEGVHLYDTDGKAYLDFAAGIAVYALGYSNDDYKKAVKDQVDKVIHVSNLFYNVPMGSAAEKLAKASGMDKVFFTNSGTESIEGAIKVARKYAYLKDGSNDHEIIAMNHSFHGRSMGALSVTGTEHYREPFEPLIGGVKFADFNDLESVKAQITDKTCAIITEVVQGEGGIYPAQKEFLEGLRALCDENDIILIFDEIQCDGISLPVEDLFVEPVSLLHTTTLQIALVGPFLKLLGNRKEYFDRRNFVRFGDPDVAQRIDESALPAFEQAADGPERTKPFLTGKRTVCHS